MNICLPAKESLSMKAIVLLSGGLDSTVCMAVAKEQNCELYPLSIN